ncbi:triose-phosphate transporter [Ophiocordyceps sinensis CO18]|uniref:GDP-mannose transporter n=1 Tax=Ophiocordyceps sinensis (strain Co18 / CGMCC 3.14243) TaxID=911162 RepID=T5AIL9_OPHSC|nr:triose-phosphate transporter [Ophiocordyceps sinensis CO18]
MSNPVQSLSPEPPSDDKELGLAERRGHGGNAEAGLLLPPEQTIAEPPSLVVAGIWMTVNTLATVGIVFTNKAIFLDSSWRLSQLTFASFHFFVTWVTLFALSRPRLGYFTPRRASIRHLLPLAVAMCLNVILPNLSLAFSSVTFYQVARILLTPMVALMNYVLYGATLPSLAIVTLVPACLGVGMVSYYDSLPIADASIKSTSPLGVVFAFVGIFASSLYTVWIASYHRTLKMSSMQLLYNQAPIASLMLLYIIPFLDAFPDWAHISTSRWMMIALVRQPPPPPPPSYYDSLPIADASIKSTSPLGVVFAFVGIFASSLYTVWIASYHRTLKMSSMQLLYNQAPIASLMLLYIIPFLDAFPDWAHISTSRWMMIALSGLFASLINISQFFIVAQTGPVSSTVVGHVKTCTIVCIGWIMSGRATGDRALVGVFLAIAAIIA